MWAERNEFRHVLNNLPAGIIITKTKSKKQFNSELKRLEEHLDDALASQRFTQPYETKFVSHYMNRVLSDCQR